VLFTLALPLVLLLNSSEGNAPNPRFGGAGTTDVLMAGYLVYDWSRHRSGPTAASA
jgi:hypothetical protein